MKDCKFKDGLDYTPKLCLKNKPQAFRTRWAQWCDPGAEAGGLRAPDQTEQNSASSSQANVRVLNRNAMSHFGFSLNTGARRMATSKLKRGERKSVALPGTQKTGRYL